MANLTLAVRRLLKTPFVTAVAVVSLALGIGANAATFSLFEQMLMRPLPVQEPARLVNLGAPGPKPGSQSCSQAGDCDVVFSYPMFRDLERQQRVFTGIAAHRGFGANLAFRRQTMNGEGMLVSGSYFPVLGLRPALGRLLGPDDDRTVGGHFVAVLSHAYWTTQLGSDPGVLNEAIVVNGQPMTIVGVAPRGFDGTTLGARPSVFVPITMRGLMSPGWKDFDNRRSYWAYLFARLRPGVELDQAKVALNGIYRPIVNDVEAPLQERMSDATMKRFRVKEVTLEPGPRGQSSVHQEARTPLVFLFAITGIVLLIACANIANLLLARAASRALEMAVRLSLGATRRQLLAQLLTESCLLALLGGVVSLVVARWTLAGIGAILPPEAVETVKLELSVPVVLFAAGLSVATGLLFGMFPALHSTRPDLVTTIRANAGQPSGARAAARFRTGLVTAQIALSMTLLVSAGLFIKSLVNVSRVNLGLRADNVVTFALSPELNAYTPERTRAFFARVEEELAATPGVTGVSASLVPILSGSNWGNDVAVEGLKREPDGDYNARFNAVGPGYFRTMGIPLLAGREFAVNDALGAPRVAIVNEAFAKKFRLGREAVGKRIGTGEKQEELNIEIVGVVQNAKYSEVKDEVPPLFFTPYRQDSTVGAMSFYVRTALSPDQLLRAVPPLVARLDPNLPVENLKTLPQQVRENVFLDRMISTMSAAFAALATLLAAVGLYGVLAYTVAQRTREIGVRMALGADAGRVRALVLRQVATMTLIGGAVGVAAALAIGRAAQSLLFELQGHDPTVVASAIALLALVALGAGYLPARRASQVEPMQALRYE
ncbi:MAG: Acidobacterial duplicated orphan permease (function unknown) [uncultured Gemmatimonadaceae bacterium]|uniref:Multidrug ABC transporter substrate-binding protein n=1 Tax=uncultured Gemmatimonadaceae bacterium TaxID=246130 RepID=A0A6J4LKP7_9BACT|nr:MAG: Acidobacterial duplicated orphan permease (function unknown) [uncultured Gemmatimonadaceae bacterium]